LIFKRYSSPFLFLENLINQGRFSEGIDVIYKQVNEEKLWNLYLSIPMKEKSYDDWKNEIVSNNHKQDEFEVAEDITDIKDKAKNILKNFKPN
jgi:hypothetical protein